jgi:DNA-binding NtrC family response regulator
MTTAIQGATAGKQSLRVLLVEDDDTDALLMRWYSGLLERYSFDLTRTRKVDTAFLELETNDYDLCLLDFWLGSETSLRLLPYLDRPSVRTAAVVVSNMTCRECETLRIPSENVVFLTKVGCTAKTLEGAVDTALSSKSMAH